MNSRSISVVKELYKPYKYTISGKAHILESTSGRIVVKEKEKDIRNLYQYLQSRGFHYFAPLIDDSREGINIFQYVEADKLEAMKSATFNIVEASMY